MITYIITKTKIFIASNKKFLKKLLFILFYIISIIGLSFISKINFNSKNSNLSGIYSNYDTLIIKYKIPSEIYFCNERVPIEYFDVYESLDREILYYTYFHSHTILGLKRSFRFFPIIEKILKEHDLPLDLKYLAVVESNLFIPSISNKGAVGIWQFMESTAKKYGLIINDEIDERYHIEKSTHAACKYLKDLYKLFNSWTLACAAYNLGETALLKSIQKQKVNNYFNLRLNLETSRFVYRIIAAKLIYENPEKFGFYIPKNDKYFPIFFKKIKVDTTINDLSEFSLNYGSNYKLLKLLNPWILGYKLSANKNKPYELYIIDTTSRYLKYIQNIYFEENYNSKIESITNDSLF